MREPLDDPPDDPLIHRAMTPFTLGLPKGPPTLHFHGGDSREIFRIVPGDPNRVELADGVTWDGAAKHFWNAVHQSVGAAEPFPKEAPAGEPDGIRTRLEKLREYREDWQQVQALFGQLRDALEPFAGLMLTRLAGQAYDEGIPLYLVGDAPYQIPPREAVLARDLMRALTVFNQTDPANLAVREDPE